MTSDRALVRLAIASLFVIGAGACRPNEPAADRAPLLTNQRLSPALRALVVAAHGHPAVGSLEAAGCELALVMTGRDYDRFVDLRHGVPMPRAADPSGQVVYCQSRAAAPPDCAQLAPIFARVARPKLPFQVLSGYADPPFAPRCAGQHGATGTYLAGEGPGYPPSRVK
jgi:hypothetical protein